MPAGRPYAQHLTRSEDLVTTYEQTRAGFVALALERNVRATPFVEQARALKSSVARVASTAELVSIPEIRPALLAAAGLSDKAAGHLEPADENDAIQVLIKQYLEPARDAFREELIYRFLLTRGDTLGGSMRNVGGALAQQRFSRTIISILDSLGLDYRWLDSDDQEWKTAAGANVGIERHLRGFSWSSNERKRVMRFNLTVPFVGKNVDVCLLDAKPTSFNDRYRRRESYLAFGELKGGIDPAGADEHWKTAGTSLSRIRGKYSGVPIPHTFFIGAAIESDMAGEIWNQLENGVLSNAANLNNQNQVDSLSGWLCGL